MVDMQLADPDTEYHLDQTCDCRLERKALLEGLQALPWVRLYPLPAQFSVHAVRACTLRGPRPFCDMGQAEMRALSAPSSLRRDGKGENLFGLLFCVGSWPGSPHNVAIRDITHVGVIEVGTRE